MRVDKLREALADLFTQRNLLDVGIERLQGLIKLLEDSPTDSGSDLAFVQSEDERQSYVSDAVNILESKGRSMHMSELLAQIEHVRGGSKLARNSVEASLARHVAKSKRPRIARMGRSLYGLAEWKARPDAEPFAMQTSLHQ